MISAFPADACLISHFDKKTGKAISEFPTIAGKTIASDASGVFLVDLAGQPGPHGGQAVPLQLAQLDRLPRGQVLGSLGEVDAGLPGDSRERRSAQRRAAYYRCG